MNFVHLSSSLEDYLEAIYYLEKENKVARVTDISRHLKIKKSSVTRALKQLAARELVNYEAYKYITLTGTGEMLAARITRKHNLLSDFLQKILLFEPQPAWEKACKMEHFINCADLTKFQDLLDFMEKNPQIKQAWLDFEHTKL
ncbi:MAG: metal-dependent transcriptional regulator [Candidatus Cloacimonadales bacterium]